MCGMGNLANFYCGVNNYQRAELVIGLQPIFSVFSVVHQNALSRKREPDYKRECYSVSRKAAKSIVIACSSARER